jgi:hypothetical protein
VDLYGSDPGLTLFVVVDAGAVRVVGQDPGDHAGGGLRVAPILDVRRDRRQNVLRHEAEGGVRVASEVRAGVETWFDAWNVKLSSMTTSTERQRLWRVSSLGFNAHMWRR